MCIQLIFKHTYIVRNIIVSVIPKQYFTSYFMR